MELINNLKRDLIAILTSNGGKSTLSQIKIYFDKELGVNIMNSFRELGIKSNREFLERMSDIIVFRPIGLSDFEVFKKFHEDSKHMDNLTISQNEKRKAKKRAKRQVVTNNRCQETFFEGKSRLKVRTPQTYAHMTKSSSVPKRITAIRSITTIQKDRQILNDFAPIIKEILIEQGGKCTDSKLDSELYKKKKIPLDNAAKSYGTSSTQFLLDLKSTITVKIENNETIIELDSSLMPLKTSEILEKDKISDEFSSKLNLNVNDLPIEADSSPSNLRKVLTDVSNLRSISNTNPFKYDLEHKMNVLLNVNRQRLARSTQDLSGSNNISTAAELSQEDTIQLTLNTKIPYPTIQRLQRSSHRIQVMDLISPSQFIIRLNTEFLDLCTKMEKHYEEKKPNHLSSVEVGNTVAVFRRNVWFRGTIQNKKEDCYEVKLIDVEMDKLVELENIFPLDQKFTKMGRKALRCCLFGIEPIENSWCLLGIIEFKKIIESKTSLLSASFKRISGYHSEIYEVEIIEETQNLNVACNLINKRLAKLKI